MDEWALGLVMVGVYEDWGNVFCLALLVMGRSVC
jgi:hypothetical protein